MSVETPLGELAPIGRTSGGYRRIPYERAERECAAWFAEQARVRGLELTIDGNGNLLAVWSPPGVSGAMVLTGSHLDSVVDGGAYDGALGVASAFAALDTLRHDGVEPTRPIGIVAFAAEEGSRFMITCLGSRLATGALAADQAAALIDASGVRLDEAMSTAGLIPDLGRSSWLQDVACFVELHLEQGRHLAERGAPIALGAGLWPHGRYRFDFAGTADHAGSTRMSDRHDPMLSFAMTVLAANKRARLSDARATFGRVEVSPNGTNVIPARVTGWLDVRAAGEPELRGVVAEITRLAGERADRDGTTLTVTVETQTGAVLFDPELITRLQPDPAPYPVVPCQTGHDAGVLSAAGIPSAMIFVRNPTGVSHSPAERVEPADCEAGVTALTAALRELAR